MDGYTLKVTFYTDNLDESKYKRAMLLFLHHVFGKKYDDYYYEINSWEVEVYPSSMSRGVPNFDGSRGIGGVTGKGIVKLYVNDNNGDMYFLENFLMISHELCHMSGIILGWNERIPLRNDDWGGNKKGTKLNKYVQEVHDRHVEGKLFTMGFWYWKKFWKIINLRVLDIRDIV